MVNLERGKIGTDLNKHNENLGLNSTKLTKIRIELNISHETLTCDNDTNLTRGSDIGTDTATCHNTDLTRGHHF